MVLASGRVAFTGTPDSLTALAAGRAWVQTNPPPAGTRASWQLSDGRYRCLGAPPHGAELVAPSLEDGYLVLTA